MQTIHNVQRFADIVPSIRGLDRHYDAFFPVDNSGGLEMNKKLHSEAVDQLFEAILCLKNKEECYTFFEDVCTINEHVIRHV